MPGMNPAQALFSVIEGVFNMEPFDKNGLCICWLGPVPIFVITRPETAEIILSSNTLTHKSIHYDFLSEWLGRGLLTSNGIKWKTRRKMLTPSFHFKILDDFIPIMNEQTSVLVKKLKEAADSPGGCVEDISKPILHLALDIICRK